MAQATAPLDNTTEELPGLADILVETKTKQAEWLIGVRVICEYVGIDGYTTTIGRLPTGLPYRRCQNLWPGKHKEMAIALRREVDAWLPTFIRRGPSRPPANATPTALPEPTNGNANAPKQGEIIVYARGAPLLNERDAENIIKALWDVKLASQTLTKAMDENTKAVREMKAAWEK